MLVSTISGGRILVPRAGVTQPAAVSFQVADAWGTDSLLYLPLTSETASTPDLHAVDLGAVKTNALNNGDDVDMLRRTFPTRLSSRAIYQESCMTQPTYVQEYDAIVEVLSMYLEGNAKGSSAAMKPAFHEKATIFGVNGQDVFGPEIQKAHDLVDTPPPSPKAQTAIARIEIVGTAASARVESDDVAGDRFTDFFNLLKIDEKWTIVSKIYYTHPSV